MICSVGVTGKEERSANRDPILIDETSDHKGNKSEPGKRERGRVSVSGERASRRQHAAVSFCTGVHHPSWHICCEMKLHMGCLSSKFVAD